MGKISDVLSKHRGKNSLFAPRRNQKEHPAADNRGVAEPNESTETPSVPFQPDNKPIISGSLDPSLVTAHMPQSFEAEQFRMLRSNLLFPINGKPPRSIMITSAVPGEGKSFISANLAVSIAYYVDSHVLLMDCDMRLPTIHKIFGFGDLPGLSEYLSQNAPLSSLLVKTAIAKLTILPAGKTPPNPSELLSSKRMFELLDETKAKFSDRFIIIDSPPPMLTAETNAIARQVDGVLLVIQYGHTPQMLAADLVESLGKEKILGVVFNQTEMIGLFNHEYRKYGKYGKYGKYFKTGPYQK